MASLDSAAGSARRGEGSGTDIGGTNDTVSTNDIYVVTIRMNNSVDIRFRIECLCPPARARDNTLASKVSFDRSLCQC